jgi:hypothetical protein
MKDHEVNIVLILELHMTHKSTINNYKSEGFRIQRFKDDMLRVLAS